MWQGTKRNRMVHYKKRKRNLIKIHWVIVYSNINSNHTLKWTSSMFISSVHVFAIYSKTWLWVHVSSRDQWIYFFILWNYFNSFRSTFIGNKNFPGLWEQNFVGRVIRINLIKYQTSACINICGYVNFVGKGCSRKPQTLYP